MSQKEKVRRHFNDYAEFWHEKLNVYGFKARRESVKRLIAGTTFSRVLDIGCGCGDYATLFDHNVEYLGVDISAEMISTAKGLYPNYAFQVADAEETGLKGESWDLVMSVAVLEYLDDPEKHMREMSRLVKVGGSIIVSVQNAEDITKRRDEAIVRELGFLRNVKRRLLPPARVVARENPLKDPGIVHHRHSEHDLRRLGSKYNLRFMGSSFVKIVAVPGLIDQYLNLNPFLSQMLDRGPFRRIFRGYIRTHSRCLTVMFEKIGVG